MTKALFQTLTVQQPAAVVYRSQVGQDEAGDDIIGH